jgi:hypothetical protein
LAVLPDKGSQQPSQKEAVERGGADDEQAAT